MQRIGCALAFAALCLSAASGAEVAPAQTKTVKLSKIILNPEIPKESQHVKVGLICLFSGTPLRFGSERTLNYEHFERLFSTTMREHHFNVIAQSSNLFDGEGNGPGPDFLIGATFHPQSVDICDSVNGQKGTIAISIEWQIYDRSKQQVVETMTTQGSGQLVKFQQDGLNAMFDQAFNASLTELINRGVVQKYLGSPAS
jgi:hypothetical protein